jgi:hypothetical protein
MSYNHFLTWDSEEEGDTMPATPFTPSNDHTSRRHRLRRAGLVTVGLVAFSLGAAACGGGSVSPGVASVGSTTSTTTATASQGGSSSSTYADAVAFAQCMRAHGVRNFPDPTSTGGFIIKGSGSSNPSHSPDYNSANKSCAHLLANGGAPMAAEQQKVAAVALKYSQCMRSHGVLNFPDPQRGGGINLGGNESIDHNTPQFQAATKTCRSVLSGLPGGATKAP